MNNDKENNYRKGRKKYFKAALGFQEKGEEVKADPDDLMKSIDSNISLSVKIDNFAAQLNNSQIVSLMKLGEFFGDMAEFKPPARPL